MEDWDLQAVVRGRTSSEVFASIMNEQSPTIFAPPVFDKEGDFVGAFADSFEHTRRDLLDGLGGPYKSFCPGLHQLPIPPQSFLNSTAPMSLPVKEAEKEKPKLEEMPREKPISESSGSGVSSLSCNDQVPQISKWKRSRKDDQKKVVQQVTVEGLSSDKWAWRKYGQKPIKGSPYPRSYYRCSSLKGCMARKQVERSSSDPSIFIVSYTAEHSHAHPPRRNALAGSTRVKSQLASSNKKVTPDNILPTTTDEDESRGTLLVASTCTATNAFSSNQDEFLQPESDRNGEGEQIMLAEEINDQLFFTDSIFADDNWYPSLGDFEGLLFD